MKRTRFHLFTLVTEDTDRWREVGTPHRPLRAEDSTGAVQSAVSRVLDSCNDGETEIISVQLIPPVYTGPGGDACHFYQLAVTFR